MTEKEYVINNAKLISEWDWEKNQENGLNPERLSHGSTKKAHWICSKGHRYVARIDHRTIMESNCPYCARKLPIIGENDLATTHPDLVLEWDYEENVHKPEEYLEGSNKKVSWVCSTCGHRWKAQIIHRALRNNKCPECAKIQRGITKTKRTLKERGDLSVTHPALAEEWDSDKNAPLTIADVHSNSRRNVWWKDSYGHSWKATVSNRTNGTGCPICAGKQLLVGFNDLETKFPDVAADWHPALNESLTPKDISAHNPQKVWWLCPDCGEAYRTSVYSRTSLRTGCPICKNRTVVPGVNDLATTHPEISKEWNDLRNKGMHPSEFVSGSNRSVWWICENGHEWEAVISSRTSGRGCPVCAQKIRPITRQKTYLKKKGSLLDKHPTIASQWHPTKNGNLSPDQVTSGSAQPVWWICEKGHEWEAVILSRTAGRGCPYCNNEHSTSFPEQILYFYLAQTTDTINRYKLDGKEIDIFLPSLNIGIEYNGRYYHQNRENQDREKYSFFREKGIRMIIVHEGEKSYIDGDDIYYEYRNSDYLNFAQSVQKVLELCKLPAVDIDIKRDRIRIFEQYSHQEKANSLANKYPHLIKEWDYERNGKLTPWLVTHGSQKRVHWKCVKCGYQWEAVVYSRKKAGCPCCAKRVPVSGINDLATTHPQLAKEWDSVQNEKQATEVVAGSHQYAWWICEKQHSWRAQIKSRAQGVGCPICAKAK